MTEFRAEGVERHRPVGQFDAEERAGRRLFDKRDRAAMVEVLQLCQPDIRRYAARHCMISDIDDAVQEALLILSRRLESVRALAALSGWLFRVVQRECRRLGRTALRFDPFDEEKLENWLAGQHSDSLRLELASALESLPATYREIILLRDFEELTIGGQEPAASGPAVGP